MKTKKRFICVLLALCMALGSFPAAGFAAGSSMSFTDVKESDWFYDAVRFVYEKGMMKGTGDSKFSPGAGTTRGMIVTILHRAEQDSVSDRISDGAKTSKAADAAAACVFTDVSQGSYYAEAVTWASENNIVSGYGDGRFRPEDLITREQMAAILYRYMKYKGYDDTEIGSKSKKELSAFSDRERVSSYASEAMKWAVGTGLITGVSSTALVPAGSAVRAQSAAILMRFFLLISENQSDIGKDNSGSDTGENEGQDSGSGNGNGSGVSGAGNSGSGSGSGGDNGSGTGSGSGNGSGNSGSGSDTGGSGSGNGSGTGGNSGSGTGSGSGDKGESGGNSGTGSGSGSGSGSGGTADTEQGTEIPENACIVTFEPNGGSPVKSVQLEKGNMLTEPTQPVRAGYLFTGWHRTPELNEMFLFDSEEVNENITLYAAWVKNDNDELLAEYASERLRIEFSSGDDAEHVTRNIVLPESIEGLENEGIVITWSSSSDSVSSDGTVIRPQYNDEEVTLTAEIRKNQAVRRADFKLNVIHENDREKSEIPNRSVIDLENLYPEGKLDLTYNEDRSQVISILGRYSDIDVENAEDAKDVIHSIRAILGIRDPYDELEPALINGDEYGREYTFAQKYKGYPVYGRRVTVSADATGTTDSLSSGFYATSNFQGISVTHELAAKDAEDAAERYYGGECAAEPDSTILTWYTLDEYEKTPVLTYQIRISGTDRKGDYRNETVFVDANSGEIINAFSEIMDFGPYSVTGSGVNELGQKVSFPVTLTLSDWYFYYLQDQNRGIQMYQGDFQKKNRTSSEFNRWTDPAAVSAYTNIILTYDWYKNTVGRHSIDGRDMDVRVATSVNYPGNSFWDQKNKVICFCDSRQGVYSRTPAAALDIAAHEYTHGVVLYTAGSLPYYNAPGAINEGYADIFACLIDGDWVMGEDWKSGRNISDPASCGDPDKMSSRFYVDYTVQSIDKGGVHINSSLVSHPAYLMCSMGISPETLAKLWYKSLSMGYDGDSDFQTVRRNVLKAAYKIRLSDRETAIVKKAFDMAEIFGDQGTLSGTVSDTEGKQIAGAEVSVYNSGGSLMKTVTTDRNGGFSTLLEEGEYRIKIDAEGYISRDSSEEIEEKITTPVNAVLVREGRGAVSGTVVSATSAMVLEGVELNVRSGINAEFGEVLEISVTDREGKYYIELDAGYYTVEMRQEGCVTGYVNVMVDGGKTTVANGSLSAVMDSSTYRVVLTWGEKPSDLDSYLIGRTAEGKDFRIFFMDRNAAKEDGTEIGCLDVDSTKGYGPETTTFTVETEGSYFFYVGQFSSTGSLPASGASVKVYNGERLIAEYDVDPSAPEEHRYWSIFRIENGIYRTINSTSADRPQETE